MQLNYQRLGSGFPLVILHGLFGSLTNWSSLSKRLAAHYTVLAVDQRNHGGSPHSDDMSYAHMADDLRELLQREGIETAHVLGHSMGGKTAMQFALAFPDLVHKLVVVDIAPRAYAPHHDEIFAAMRALDLAAATSRAELDTDLARTLLDPAVRQFLLTNIARDDNGSFRWKINLNGIERAYPSIVGSLEATARFDGPALFIRGERSDYVAPDDQPAIKEIFPHAEFATIPGAGHWVHAEAPTEFLRVLQEFLES
jgi:esterase